MSRLLWFAVGAGAGVHAVVRARRAAEALTPDGLADRLAGLSLGAHLFTAEVKAGMAEKEKDLRGRLALPLHGATPQLPGGGSGGAPADPDPAPPGAAPAPTREATD